MTRILMILLVGVVALSGCSRKLRVDPGPDEFAIQPARSLVEPADYTQLPAPGAAPSRAQVSPFAMAYGAMGGSAATPPRLLGAGAVSSNGGGGLLFGLFGGNSNAEVLDPRAEASRLAGLGIPTSTAN